MQDLHLKHNDKTGYSLTRALTLLELQRLKAFTRAKGSITIVMSSLQKNKRLVSVSRHFMFASNQPMANPSSQTHQMVQGRQQARDKRMGQRQQK